MSSSEKFCLKWNDFESNISVAFREIREEKDFFDCTLSCGSRQIQAHKLILSACSPFFRTILRQNPHQHPLLYLKGIEFTDLQAVLNFMYHGEVNVAHEELNSFLSVAEDLKIKGLTQNTENSTPKTRPEQLAVPAPRPRPATNEDQSTKLGRPQTISAAHPESVHHTDTIQEVMPVPVLKQEFPILMVEPTQPLTQPLDTIPHTDQTSITSHSAIQQGHTMAQMESYGDDGYDYGEYNHEGGEGYEGGMMDTTGGTVHNKDPLAFTMRKKSASMDDIDGKIEELIFVENGCWGCKKCGKVMRKKQHIKNHAESHLEGYSHPCPFCRKCSALSNHISYFHKHPMAKMPL